MANIIHFGWGSSSEESAEYEFVVSEHFTFGKSPIDGSELDWIIVDTSNSEYVTLGLAEILVSYEFDAKEPNNTDSNRTKYGNNRWKYSNIRQWLNSDKAANSWFTNQHSYDAAPSYANVNGFLRNFSDEEKAAIIPATNVTALATVDGGGSETTTDTVWLPSYTQMGFGTNNGISEGTALEYYGTQTNRPGNNYPWMRSPYVGISNYVWGVNTDGSADYYGAYYSFGVRPCLNIKRTYSK